MQVFDEGMLTDGLGRQVDFSNTIIIMTSNVGTKKLKDFGDGVGFQTKTKLGQKQNYYKNVIKDALKKTFNPEFLNRLDEIVIFNDLEKDDLLKIIDIEIDKLIDRTKELGIEFEITKSVKQWIADKAFAEKLGARPIQRSIQQNIENKISELLLDDKTTKGEKLLITLVKDEINIKKEKKKISRTD